MAYTDEQIINANNGNILPGEYVIFPGYVSIKWTVNGIDTVDLFLEKYINDTKTETKIAENIRCIPNERGENVPKIYNWVCDIIANKTLPYPKYRIKIVSSQYNNILTYSNYFKVSVRMPLVPIEPPAPAD